MTTPVVAVDKYSKKLTELTSPMSSGFTITKSDTDQLAYVTRSIWVGTTGDLAVVFANDTTNTPVILKAIPNGTQLFIRVKQVMSTDTSASNLVGMY